MKKIKMFLFVFLAIALLALTSCASSNGGVENPGGSPGEVTADTTAKLIYNVSYKVEASNYKEVYANITNTAKELGGYLYNINENTDSIYAVYKLPTSKLNEFLAYIDATEGSSNKVLDCKDVTSEYNEIESSISVYEARKQAYMNMLNNDTLSMSDIIAINDKIDQIDEKLKALYSSKASYDSVVNYSTITIRYYESEQTGFALFMSNYGAFLLNSLLVIVTIIAYSAPFALLSGVIIFALTYKKKRQVNKN